jgi:hypothetical protein
VRPLPDNPRCYERLDGKAFFSEIHADGIEAGEHQGEDVASCRASNRDQGVSTEARRDIRGGGAQDQTGRVRLGSSRSADSDTSEARQESADQALTSPAARPPHPGEGGEAGGPRGGATPTSRYRFKRAGRSAQRKRTVRYEPTLRRQATRASIPDT